MKKISIHRCSDKKGATGYTPISNKIIQGSLLSLEEVGVLSFLLSKPVDYNIIQKNILKDLKGRISAGGFRTAWKGLVEKGYVVKYVYYKDNLRRDRWEIYENPENRDIRNREYQNRDSREPVPLQSKEIQSKNIKSKEIESTSTRTSILGKNSSSIKPMTMFEKFTQQCEEAVMYLATATELKEKIFDYVYPNKIDQLKTLIGPVQYKIIEPNLTKYMEATRHLGY